MSVNIIPYSPRLDSCSCLYRNGEAMLRGNVTHRRFPSCAMTPSFLPPHPPHPTSCQLLSGDAQTVPTSFGPDFGTKGTELDVKTMTGEFYVSVAPHPHPPEGRHATPNPTENNELQEVGLSLIHHIHNDFLPRSPLQLHSLFQPVCVCARCTLSPF